MPLLHIYLAEGFKDDRVAVNVDGRTVFDERGITTKSLLGLAQEIDPVAVVGGTARLDVALPDKGLRTAFNVDLGRGSHVPVSIEDGQLVHSVEKQIGFG